MIRDELRPAAVETHSPFTGARVCWIFTPWEWSQLRNLGVRITERVWSINPGSPAGLRFIRARIQSETIRLCRLTSQFHRARIHIQFECLMI
ncbi:MAG: hypothetical protein V7609_243 [Verrucomicrobiota bacterium]